MTVDASSRELAYSQALAELKDISANANSLDELIQQSVEIIKSKFDFVFVGVGFLDATKEYLRRYRGTDGRYQKRMLGLGINIDNPLTRVIRTGNPCVAHATDKNYFANPDFPDERVEFYLPLKTDKGNFGTVEITSTRDSDWDEALQIFPLLENLVSQVASACIKWVDDENIGFWINQD